MPVAAVSNRQALPYGKKIRDPWWACGSFRNAGGSGFMVPFPMVGGVVGGDASFSWWIFLVLGRRKGEDKAWRLETAATVGCLLFHGGSSCVAGAAKGRMGLAVGNRRHGSELAVTFRLHRITRFLDG